MNCSCKCEDIVAHSSLELGLCPVPSTKPNFTFSHPVERSIFTNSDQWGGAMWALRMLLLASLLGPAALVNAHDGFIILKGNVAASIP
ncbi:hypothetical protein MHYP_G00244250 [Metynnis hypsauchen]